MKILAATVALMLLPLVGAGQGKAVCPSCGSDSLYLVNEDQYFLSCYGNGYWERGFYPPSGLRPVNVCGECGTVYLPLATKRPLLSSLQNYLQDCHNDSTLEWMIPSRQYACDSLGYGWANAIYCPPIRRWTYRLPTLPGFKEFIERRRR